MNSCQSPYFIKALVGSITNSHLPFRSVPLAKCARRSFLPRGVTEKSTLIPSSSPCYVSRPVAPTHPLCKRSPMSLSRYRYEPVVILLFCLPLSPYRATHVCTHTPLLKIFANSSLFSFVLRICIVDVPALRLSGLTDTSLSRPSPDRI